jgi:hypothetical protein
VYILGGDGGLAAIAKDKEYYYVSYQNGAVLREVIDENGRREDEPGRETRIDPKETGPRLLVHPWVLNPANTKMMFYSGNTHIWRNHNVTEVPKYVQQSEVNWRKLPATEGDSWATALEISTMPPNRLYYARPEGQLFRLDDAHEANPIPVDVSSDQFPTSDLAWINSIAVDRQNANYVLVAVSNYESPSIFFSKNGGEFFSDVSGSLEEFPDGSGGGPSVRWVEILNYKGTRYYFAGTTVGLFYTTEIRPVITEWHRVGAETIGNVRVDMIESRDEDGLIVVATHGNGIYSTNVSSLAPVAIENVPEVPSAPILATNYPNPFSRSTTIAFTLSEPSAVSLEVFDLLGRRVVTLVADDVLAPGRHERVWNAADLPSGEYMVRLRAGETLTSGTAVVAR